MIKRKRKLNKMLITHPDILKVISNSGSHCFPVGTLVRRVGATRYENVEHVKCTPEFAQYPGEMIHPGMQQVLWGDEVGK